MPIVVLVILWILFGLCGAFITVRMDYKQKTENGGEYVFKIKDTKGLLFLTCFGLITFTLAIWEYVEEYEGVELFSTKNKPKPNSVEDIFPDRDK